MTERNQCDGCAAGAPMRNLIGTGPGCHIMPDGDLIGCTADRYGHPVATVEGDGLGQKTEGGKKQDFIDAYRYYTEKMAAEGEKA